MPDLSDGTLWSEIDALNNSPAPNGWPEGMMPSGVNDSARADRGALKRFWNKINPVQWITPSGGLYVFTTANLAYPTLYLSGEIYYFGPEVSSIGGDQFRVNALPSKPIWKCVSIAGSGSYGPIIARDIFGGVPAQLIYDGDLNAGAGAFILLNPFVPISGDGAGGVSVPGGLAVAGDLTMAGSVTAAGGMAINGDLQVTGRVNATGYASRSGLGGPYQTNAFNIQWTGADGAHLWIDTTDQGPIVCAPGGNIVVGGITAGSLSVSGNTTVAGRAALMQVDFGASQASRTGYFDGSNGNFSANGTATVGSVTATSAGGLGGGISIYATNGGIRSDVSGTALYLPNGDVVCHSVTAAGGITVNAGGVNISGGNLSVGGRVGFGAGGSILGSNELSVTGDVGIVGNMNITGTLNSHPAIMMAEFAASLAPGEMAVIARSADGELTAQRVVPMAADEHGRRLLYIN